MYSSLKNETVAATFDTTTSAFDLATRSFIVSQEQAAQIMLSVLVSNASSLFGYIKTIPAQWLDLSKMDRC